MTDTASISSVRSSSASCRNCSGENPRISAGTDTESSNGVLLCSFMFVVLSTQFAQRIALFHSRSSLSNKIGNITQNPDAVAERIKMGIRLIGQLPGVHTCTVDTHE